MRKRLLLAGLAVALTVMGFVSSLAAGRDTVLVVHTGERYFLPAIQGLREGLSGEFAVEEWIVKRNATAQSLLNGIFSCSPSVVVLLDNKAISLFKDCQQAFPEKTAGLPSVSMMAVNVEKAIEPLKNAVGISYEVPIVTAMVQFRSVFNRPIRRVGVVHRAFMDDFVTHNDQLCRQENLTLVPVRLPNEGVVFRVETEKALRHLLDQEKVDALWLPNDNALLSPEIIQQVWVPLLGGRLIPLVVSLEIFVSPELNFGTFAVLPDTLAMGHQAAEMVFALREQQWKTGATRTVPPISVYTIVNFLQAVQKFEIPEANLDNVDKVLK